MRIPLSWLREYVPVPEAATAKDVMATLVNVGLEEEGVIRSGLSGPIVVGRISSCVPEPQKNGKTINWCQVDVGEDAPRGIVCGAHNFAVGDKVVVCLPGAILPGDFKISARKTYGHLSDGMIASARELGLGRDHEGILRFADLSLDPNVGEDALEALGLTDEAADINVTPDRAYCLSIRGVAREYSHASSAENEETPFVNPQFLDPAATYRGRGLIVPETTANGYPVEFEDRRPIHGKPGVDRFVVRVVHQVDAGARTPRWMQERLRLAGIHPKSVIVDITNYVMLELGQPLHAYDLDKVDGDIVVRRAEAGERLTTLDGEDRRLDREDLVIADGSGVIGLAGIMGGLSTAVSDFTVNVLIEAAHFEAVTVSRSSRRHKILSEAAKRFARGVDPQVAGAAAEKAVLLLRDLAGGRAGTAVTDRGETVKTEAIFLPYHYVSERIGIDYSAADIQNTLKAIGCRVQVCAESSGNTGEKPKIEDQPAGYRVTPPSWRMDLVDAAGLSEEVARLVGYDKIPARRPQGLSGRGYTSKQIKHRRVADALAASGLVEVTSPPFVSGRSNAIFSWPNPNATPPSRNGSRKSESVVEALKIENPLSAEFCYLRRSLLANLANVVRRNIARGFKDITLYEIGTVFIPRSNLGNGTADGETVTASLKPSIGRRPEDAVLEALNLSLPLQPTWVAAILTGKRPDYIPTEFDVRRASAASRTENETYGWPDAIDCARFIADTLKVKLTVEQGEHRAFHPGRTAELTINDENRARTVGFAGELHPRVIDELGLPKRTVAMELALDELVELSPQTVSAAPISTYPVTTQDVALIVDEDLPARKLQDLLREHAGDLLEDIKLFDDYRGAGMESGKKSLAFSLTFRADNRTLTAEEASMARDRAVAEAEKKYSARLRG